MGDAERRGIVLKGILVECGVIVGYLVDAYNKGAVDTKKVPKNKLVQLMGKGISVEGAELFNGELCIRQDVLSALDVIKGKYSIIDSIEGAGNKTIGYIISGEDGKQLRLSIQEAWKLAANDSIIDTKACIEKGSNKKYIVRTDNVQ